LSLRAIGEKLGISATQVMRDLKVIDAELCKSIVENTDAYRAECLATLQRVIRVGWTTIKPISTKDAGIIEYAAPSLGEINDAVGRIAKLLGLNAPEDIKVGATISASPVVEDAARGICELLGLKAAGSREAPSADSVREDPGSEKELPDLLGGGGQG
jgi:hypothetical protein